MILNAGIGVVQEICRLWSYQYNMKWKKGEMGKTGFYSNIYYTTL